MDLNKFVATPINYDEQANINGGGFLPTTGGGLCRAIVKFLEQAGKGIAEANEHTPYYGQGK